MTNDNWIMIISALIVAIGWFVTWYLEQKNEIIKERRSYRLDMLHSFYPIIFFIQKKNYKIRPGQEAEELEKLLAEARSKFLLYGEKDEIEAYENVVAAFLGEDNEDKTIYLNKLADIVRTKIRTELGLPAHILSKR